MNMNGFYFGGVRRRAVRIVLPQGGAEPGGARLSSVVALKAGEAWKGVCVWGGGSKEVKDSLRSPPFGKCQNPRNLPAKGQNH